MLLELEENRRGNIFIRSRMDQYSFYYLLYKTLCQKNDCVSDISKLIKNLNVSKDIKQILAKYIHDFPQGFEDSDFDSINERRLYRYFSSFRLHQIRRYNEMYSTSYMSRLAAKLLNTKESDRLADFYGAPENFLRIVYQNDETIPSFTTRPVCYSGYETVRDFLILINDVLYSEGKQIDILNKDIFAETDSVTFDKIYACIPVFQNSSREETRRILQNVIRSEDYSLKYVSNVLEHLAPGGRAVICISDSLFTNKTNELRKYICDSGCFKGLIRFSAGEIYPNNLSSSLLIFDKARAGNSFVFLDLCDVERHGFRSSVIEQLGAENIISMFNSKDPVEREGVVHKVCRYQELKKAEFEFDTKFNPVEFLLNYKPKSESDAAAEKIITLGENATISRGVQDIENIRAFETKNPAAPFYYLSVSDIQEGSIQFESMTRLSEKKDNWDKYLLKNGDVIITKTAYPSIKVAIYEGPDNQVIPASNLYVIRMNYGDSSRLNPYYLKLYLESELGQKYLKSVISGTKLPAITKENLENLELPYKSEKEQKEMEATYKDTIATIEKHKQAIKNLRHYLGTVITNYI